MTAAQEDVIASALPFVSGDLTPQSKVGSPLDRSLAAAASPVLKSSSEGGLSEGSPTPPPRKARTKSALADAVPPPARPQHELDVETHHSLSAATRNLPVSPAVDFDRRRSELKEQIAAWKAKFELENGRPATKADKRDVALFKEYTRLTMESS